MLMRSTLFAAAATLAVSLAACSEEHCPSTAADCVQPTPLAGVTVKVDLSQPAARGPGILLASGDQEQLMFTLDSAGKIFEANFPPQSYRSSNTNVATIDASGLITARGAGNAYVYITVFGHTDSAAVSVRSSTLPAPQPLSPPDRSLIEKFPRDTTLTWSAVPNAVSYDVDIQVCAPAPAVSTPWYDKCDWFVFYQQSTVNAPSFSFRFAGSNPGRWRVRAFDAQGTPGKWSVWRTFYFLL